MHIEKRVSEITDQLVSFRRAMHAYPELGMEEIETNKKIRAFLSELGIPNRSIAQTGVIAQIGTGQSPVVALRADIDALPIDEQTNLPYRSQLPGKMHACGHDLHTSIQLGAAQILKEMENELQGTVKFLFEPAEETIGGAQQMVHEGCLESPPVDAILGLHVMPNLNTGIAEIKYGKMNAASDIITLSVKGKAGHGAYPEKATDAILIAASIVSALQSLVSRNVSPLNSVVLSFGAIHGGTFGNVIASEVSLKGILRTLDPDTRAYAQQRIAEIAQLQARSFGGEAIVQIEAGYKPVINHPQITQILENTLLAYLGNEKLVHKEYPSLGVESFSYFSSEVPGSFYHLGCRRPTDTETQTLHSALFNPDEKVIEIGVNTQVRAVLALLSQLNPHNPHK